MRDRLFIRIDQNFPEQVSWLRISDDAGRHLSLSRGTLRDAGQEAAGCQLIVLVPGVDVLLTQAVVPSRQRQHIINAIPFALEDQLASDIDELHFALGPRNDAGVVPVAVVARQTMRGWLEHLRDAGLEPDMMVPDVLALPLQDNAWTALHDGDTVLIRQGGYAGAVIDTLAVNEWFDLALGELSAEGGEERPQQIRLLDCQHDTDAQLILDVAAASGGSHISIDVYAQQDAPIQLLAQNFSSVNTVNLIQGDYSPREQIGRVLRPWRVAMVLLFILALLGLGKSVLDLVSLNKANDRLMTEINQIYLDTFPTARKVVDARVQMERKLAELSAGGSDSGQGFLPLLALISPSLQDIDSVELRHASYQDGRLSLSLRIKSLQLLEQLKQKLLAAKDLNVDIQSAASRDNYVDARLQLWRQGS